MMSGNLFELLGSFFRVKNLYSFNKIVKYDISSLR